MSTKRLTEPQRRLLAELRESGGLYITRRSRYGRTVEALADKGLARITEHDYSRLGQDRWEAVDDD